MGAQHQTCLSAFLWPGLCLHQGTISLVTVMKLWLEVQLELRM